MFQPFTDLNQGVRIFYKIKIILGNQYLNYSLIFSQHIYTVSSFLSTFKEFGDNQHFDSVVWFWTGWLNLALHYFDAKLGSLAHLVKQDCHCNLIFLGVNPHTTQVEEQLLIRSGATAAMMQKTWLRIISHMNCSVSHLKEMKLVCMLDAQACMVAFL